jgi:hypothetical protein
LFWSVGINIFLSAKVKDIVFTNKDYEEIESISSQFLYLSCSISDITIKNIILSNHPIRFGSFLVIEDPVKI